MPENHVHDPRPIAALPGAASGTPAECAVIIPNFNHGSYLSAITSAYLTATRPPDIVVIVDDASTDDSREVIAGLIGKDPRIRLIAREKNGGPNIAIQAGLASIDSEYCVLTSANDWVGPQFLERSLAILEKHPQAAYTFSEPVHFRTDDGPVDRYTLALGDEPVFLPPARFEAALKKAAFTVATNSMVYRRRFLVDFGGFDPKLSVHADWYAAMGLALRHGACFVPDHLALQRLHDDAYSKTGMATWPARRDAVAAVLEKLDHEDADIRAALRRADVVPDYDMRVIALLMRGGWRDFLSIRLVLRLVIRHVGSWLRPLASRRFRIWLRKVATWR